LDGAELARPGGCGGIPKNRHPRHSGRNLFEQFQPFRAHAVFEQGESGGIAARPRQAVDEAGADRIDDGREHDRYGAGRLQQRPHGRGGMGQDDVGRERGQFRRVPANLGNIGRSPSCVDAHVAADGPARLLQALMKCRNAGLHSRIVRGCGQQHADNAHPFGLLCSRHRWPSHRAAEQRNKIATPQCVHPRVPERRFRSNSS
jgi:hypothetical protein